MAEELNTTVNDVLNLMLRRVTRLELQIFIDFLLDMRVCDDVLGEVACSTAHPVTALYQLDVYGYVAEWVSRVLIRGKVTSAMVLAEKFGLPSMVIHRAYFSLPRVWNFSTNLAPRPFRHSLISEAGAGFVEKFQWNSS